MRAESQGTGTAWGPSAVCVQGGGGLRAWLLPALALAILWPSQATAQSSLLGRRSVFKAANSRAVRQEAERSIPLEKLEPSARAKVESVLGDVALFRRLPVQVIQCDPDMYLFLVEHPDVVVNIWEVFGITQLSLREIGPDTFSVTEAAGTKGTMEYLYCSHDTHLIYAEGRCEGPVLARPIHGRVLAVLKTGYVREPDGRYYVTCRLDAFLQVDRAGVELVTRTLQPVVGRVADLNFVQAASFIGSLSRTAEVNLGGVERLAGKLSGVQPQVRDQFVELAVRVADKADESPGANPPQVARQQTAQRSQ